MVERRSVTVVGAGVIGLTTATEAVDRGFDVNVVAHRLDGWTTSRAAAAFWYPFAAGVYDPAWALESYERFRGLAGEPGAGVLASRVHEFFLSDADYERFLEDSRGWRERVGVRRIPTGRRYRGHRVVAAIGFDSFVVEMPTYLASLRGRLAASGRVAWIDLPKPILTLATVAASADVATLDCMGLGARYLLETRGVELRESEFGVEWLTDGRWGQLEHVDAGAPWRADPVWLAHYGEHGGSGESIDLEQFPAYVVPRSGDTVLGGWVAAAEATAETVFAPPAPRPEVTAAILRACEPLIGPGARCVAPTTTGVRPCRPIVRVELDEGTTERVVVHNYGHGGAGVTLSWGCARAAMDLAIEAFRSRDRRAPQ